MLMSDYAGHMCIWLTSTRKEEISLDQEGTLEADRPAVVSRHRQETCEVLELTTRIGVLQ